MVTEPGRLVTDLPFIDDQNPWPGLDPYDERAVRFFNGRTYESYELLRRVMAEHLTVLYGKSGLGKTSLLKAGLFPFLRRERFLPVYIRLDVQRSREPLIDQVADAFRSELSIQRAEAPIFGKSETLWEYLHHKDFELWSEDNWQLTPVFVLDQMEEIFTLGHTNPEGVKTFRYDLADLIENRIPPALADRQEKGGGLRHLDFNARVIKVLLSFREDYLPDFDVWCRDIPSMIHNRFRLMPMTIEQGIEAVYRTGSGLVEQDLAQEIVLFISGAQQDPSLHSLEDQEPVQGRSHENPVVEPAYLSVLCTGLNKKRKEKKRDKFYKDQLSDMGGEVIKDFYNDALAGLQENVRRFIQDDLITEMGYRKPCSFDDASRKGVSEEVLQKLVKRRMATVEERLGTKWLELKHDLLTEVIRADRDDRRKKEEIEKARKDMEDEADRRERELKAKSAGKLKRLSIGLAFCCLVVAILALLEYKQIFRARASALAAHAEHQLRTDPELAVLLSLESLKAAETRQGERVLRICFAEYSPHNNKPLEHKGAVLYAFFSPDALRVVTASQDKTARIWDAETGDPVLVLTGHQEGLTMAAFSNDGKRVLTASFDKTARIWDAETGKPLHNLQGHKEVVTMATFSPDGLRVLTASLDKTARIWDAETGDPVLVLTGHQEVVKMAAFSNDGKRVLTASYDKSARIWDAETGKLLHNLKGHKEVVTTAVFSKDGRRVLTASSDKTARIWNAESGDLIHLLEGHKGTLSSVSFDSKDKLVVTASSDETARLWDGETGIVLTVLRAHKGRINGAAFDRNSKRLVTASLDQTARIWTLQEKKELRDHPHAVTVAYSPDGKRMVTAGRDAEARTWNAETGDPIGQPLRHDGEVTSAAFSRDGKRLVTASWDGTARIWNAETGEQIGKPLKHDDIVTSAAFSPNGRRVITASWDRTARIWNAETGEPIGKPFKHDGKVASAVFSPSGKWLVTASSDKKARIWDAETGDQIHVLEGHTDRLANATFDSDGKRVLSASYDSTACIWDAKTGRKIAVLEGHKDLLNRASFDGSSKLIVTASADKTVRVWDAEKGIQLSVFGGLDYPVTSAVFSPAGKWLAVTYEDPYTNPWIFKCEISAELDELVKLAKERITRKLTPEERELYLD